MAVPYLTLGCPPVTDYLKAREKTSAYNPVDEAGFTKLVFEGDTRQLAIHWADGTKTSIGVDTKKVLVSNTDTTEGFLGQKLVAGNSIQLNTLNAGANEQIQVSVSLDPTLNSQVLFNNNGVIGMSPGFTFNSTTSVLLVDNVQVTTNYLSSLGNAGLSRTIQIVDTTGTHTLTFENGLLVNYTFV